MSDSRDIIGTGAQGNCKLTSMRGMALGYEQRCKVPWVQGYEVWKPAPLLFHPKVRHAGLTLVGFKDNSRLKMYDQLRPSSFLYPNEAKLPGSAKAFIALHDQLLKKGKHAVCRAVRTAASGPRMVAVVPQEELIDKETKEQVGNPPPLSPAT
jgi:hypothetical protein